MSKKRKAALKKRKIKKIKRKERERTNRLKGLSKKVPVTAKPNFGEVLKQYQEITIDRKDEK